MIRALLGAEARVEISRSRFNILIMSGRFHVVAKSRPIYPVIPITSLDLDVKFTNSPRLRGDPGQCRREVGERLCVTSHGGIELVCQQITTFN